MSEVERGVKFVLRAEAEESVASEFKSLADRGERLRGMLGNIKLGGLDLSRFQTSLDRAFAQLDAFHAKAMQPVNITSIATHQEFASPIAGASGAPDAAATHQPARLEAGTAAAKATRISDTMSHTLGAPGPTDPESHATPATTENPGLPKPAPFLIPTKVQDPKKLKATLQKIVSDDKAAEEKMTAASTAGAARRAAGLAAKLQADQEAELTRRNEAENKRRAALPKKVRAAEAEQRQTETRQTQENQKRAADSHERASHKAEELNDRLRASLAEAAEGAKEFGKDLVEVGLVSEEALQKVSDAVERVQAAIDLVKNGVKVWHALHESVKLYQEGLLAAKGAEEALLAVEKAHSVLGSGSAIPAATSVAGQAAGAAEGAVAQAIGGAGGVQAVIGQIGSKIAMAITPLTLGVAAIGVAIYAGVKYGLDKWKEASERAAKEEAEADERGLQGSHRQEYIATRSAIDQNELALKQAEEELRKIEEMPERSRQKGNEVPFNPSAAKETEESRGYWGTISHALFDEPDRSESEQLEIIAAERERKQRQLDQIHRHQRPRSEADPEVASSQASMAAALRARIVELDLKKAEIEKRHKPAEGFNRFAADPQVEAQAAAEKAEIEKRIVDLKTEQAQLNRQSFEQQAAALAEELQTVQALLEADKERVTQAKAYADATHKAYEDQLVEFGLLSKSKQARYRRIQEKLDRGEQLTRKELKDAVQGPGERMRVQAREQAANSVSDEDQKLLFGNEKKRSEDALNDYYSASAKEAHDTQRLGEIEEKRRRLNADEGQKAGEQAHYKMSVDGKATVDLEVKWDKASSTQIADAINKKLVPKVREAIADLLKETVTRLEVEEIVRQALQRKGQATSAGA